MKEQNDQCRKSKQYIPRRADAVKIPLAFYHDVSLSFPTEKYRLQLLCKTYPVFSFVSTNRLSDRELHKNTSKKDRLCLSFLLRFDDGGHPEEVFTKFSLFLSSFLAGKQVFILWKGGLCGWITAIQKEPYVPSAANGHRKTPRSALSAGRVWCRKKPYVHVVGKGFPEDGFACTAAICWPNHVRSAGRNCWARKNSARNAEGLCAVGEASNPKRFLIKMTLSHKGERREKEGKDKTEKALVCLGLLRIPT